MEEKNLIKILISAMIALIFDITFSVTEIIKQYLDEVPQIKEIILINLITNKLIDNLIK